MNMNMNTKCVITLAKLLFNVTEQEAFLSTSILHYMGNFAWSGNPNYDGRGYTVRNWVYIGCICCMWVYFLNVFM